MFISNKKIKEEFENIQEYLRKRNLSNFESKCLLIAVFEYLTYLSMKNNFTNNYELKVKNEK